MTVSKVKILKMSAERYLSLCGKAPSDYLIEGVNLTTWYDRGNISDLMNDFVRIVPEDTEAVTDFEASLTRLDGMDRICAVATGIALKPKYPKGM